MRVPILILTFLIFSVMLVISGKVKRNSIFNNKMDISSFKRYLNDDWRFNAMYSNLLESSYISNRHQLKRIPKATDKKLIMPETIDSFRDIFRRKN